MEVKVIPAPADDAEPDWAWGVGLIFALGAAFWGAVLFFALGGCG